MRPEFHGNPVSGLSSITRWMLGSPAHSATAIPARELGLAQRHVSPGWYTADRRTQPQLSRGGTVLQNKVTHMAGSLNKVLLMGNLGRDPEVRFTTGGTAVANFSIATSESWKDKAGNPQDRTEWHRIVVWGKLAELCGEYLKKGRQVFVEGRLQTREWTDKENKKNYSTEIVASNVTFIGPRPEGAGAPAAAGNANAAPQQPGNYGPPPGDDMAPPPGGADDIPF